MECSYKKRYIIYKIFNGFVNRKNAAYILVSFSLLQPIGITMFLKDAKVLATKNCEENKIRIIHEDTYDGYKFDSHVPTDRINKFLFDGKNHFLEFDSDEDAKLFFECGEY